MKPDDVARFVSCPFGELAELDREHWRQERHARGSIATLEASAALREHMRTVRPDWPSDADREADFEAHLELRRLLDRASALLARKR